MKYSSVFILLFALFVPITIYLLPMLGFGDVLYKLDIHSPFWVFSLQLGLGLLLFVKLFGDFRKWIANIICETKIHTLLALLVIVAIALFISIAWIEGGSRVEADESVYLTAAQNLYHNQIGIHCMEGSFIGDDLACVIKASVKARGLSYIYMLGMPFFGKDLYWVYNFQTFLLFLTLPIFFLALKAWTKSDRLSILSVALLASVPILLFQFRSASIESVYVFFFVLSLLFLKWAYDSNTTRHWLLLALTLAFFAQTRSETILCLFAFIGVAFYRLNPDFKIFKLSTLNSQLSAFLATLSFFSLPILCTLSLNRDSDLQGGSYGARGYLFENIAEDFKIMALSNPDHEGLLQVPFFPYFTWLALFGLITLIVLAVKEFKEKLPKKYLYITAFILLLSPQYLLLFDSVSADFKLTIQQRFILVPLPALAFLGAIFLNQLSSFLKNSNKLLNPVNMCIFFIGIITINTLLYGESFKKNIMYRHDLLSQEKNFIYNWLKTQSNEKKIFFYASPVLFLSHGYSSYGYNLAFSLDFTDIQEIQKEYNEDLYIAKGFHCNKIYEVPKMTGPLYSSMCKQFDEYFEYETIIENSNTSIHRIKNLSSRDPKGLFRLIDFREDTKDSLLIVYFTLPKRDSVPWKIQRYINDDLLFENLYRYSYDEDRKSNIDYYKISLLKQDTNIIDFKIVDMITGDTVHKDYLKLKRKELK